MVTDNADGNRVKGVSGSKTTRTFFPFYVEETVGSTTTVVKYYTFNGMTIAMRQDSTLSYLHTDHLSSNSVSTNASGVETARRTYYAYGSPRTSSGTLPTGRTYTGQEYPSPARPGDRPDGL